ncbi:MAG: VWA domain-containing protein [Verrucomicrobiota bacterium]
MKNLSRLLLGVFCVFGFAGGLLAKSGGPEIRLNVGLDHGLLISGETSKAYLKVGLLPERGDFEVDRTPIRVAIVLDRSGSMGTDKMETAKKAVIQAVRLLYPNDHVSVIAYDDKVEVVVPMTRKSKLEVFESKVRSIQARGSTAIYAGVNEAANELRKVLSDTSVNRVLLLSDGLANVGPQTPGDFDRLGRALQSEGISVSTVGLGIDYNEDLMTSLSGAGEGNAYFAEGTADLPRIFENEIGSSAAIVARDAKVEVLFAKGVKPIRIMGRSGSVTGDTVSFELKNLFLGDEKYALIEVEVDGRASGSEISLARVRAKYRDFENRGGEVYRDSVMVGFTGDVEEQERSVDLGVQREVVRIQIAEARERAIELADAGREKEAADYVQQTWESVAQQNSAWGDEEIANQNIELQMQVADLQNEGMSKKNRKALRRDAYSSLNQTKK